VLEVDHMGDAMTRMEPILSDDLPVQGSVQIVRLGHIEYRVTDLERARHFYVDLLGFHESERDRDHVYLRAIEDREHHSVTLRKASVSREMVVFSAC